MRTFNVLAKSAIARLKSVKSRHESIKTHEYKNIYCYFFIL